MFVYNIAQEILSLNKNTATSTKYFYDRLFHCVKNNSEFRKYICELSARNREYASVASFSGVERQNPLSGCEMAQK